jgi:predicted protein tyrosine phosphatase
MYNFDIKFIIGFKGNKMGLVNNLTTAKTKNIECIIGIEEFECIEDFDYKNLVLISITNPGEDFVESNLTNKFKNKLEIQFNDIRKFHDKYNHLIISNEEGRIIKDFILQNRNEKFVIHCSAGISRSSAVGCAIECLFEYNGDVEKYWESKCEIKKHFRYSPNIIVFNKILNSNLPVIYKD